MPKHCMPQPENHRPRKVPPHAPLAMGSVDGATKIELHRPHNPHREGHLSKVGMEGLFLLTASWQTEYEKTESNDCLKRR